MVQFIQILVVSLVVVALAGWWWRRWRKAQLKARRELAMLEFNEQRSELQERFLAAASATGKPRGLRWKQCDLLLDEIFACDRVSGELYALVGTTVSFEAIPGSDMEDVEAVGNLRAAAVGMLGDQHLAIFADNRINIGLV